MAAMKLYYGDNLVGGEVDLAEFEKLQTDVEGKYDKGDPSILEGNVMEYDNAALMEMAVKGNTAEIDSLNSKLDEWLANDKPELIVELQNLYPKYKDDDNDQAALIYDSAAKMGLAVAKNTQDIEANKRAITDGDAATLTAANQHSDDNDVVTLEAANKYTDDAIADIDGIDGLQEIETEAVRNANRAGAAPGDPEAGVMRMEVVKEMPDSPDEFTLYVVTG